MTTQHVYQDRGDSGGKNLAAALDGNIADSLPAVGAALNTDAVRHTWPPKNSRALIWA